MRKLLVGTFGIAMFGSAIFGQTPFILTGVKGRVIDADTDQPVKKLQVSVTEVRYKAGKSSLLGGTDARVFRAATNEAGEFATSNQSIGKYGIVVQPKLWSDAARHLLTFSKNDLDVVDEDYEESFWPGGAGPDNVAPLQVFDGLVADAGTLAIRKTKLYRAHVVFSEANCNPGDSFRARLFQQMPDSQWRDQGKLTASCGRDFLLRGLPQGTYQLELMSPGNWPVDKQKWASVPFTITDRNVEVVATMQRGIDLKGEITSASSQFWILGTLSIGLSKEPRLLNFTKTGRFQIQNVPIGVMSLQINNLPFGKILSPMSPEFRYRGVASPLEFFWDGNGSIEFAVDDKPAGIAGSVKQGDAPVQAEIIAVKWPFPPGPGGIFLNRSTGQGDESGNFILSRLTRGDYRIIAVKTTSLSRLEEPGVLERLMRNAEKVTVDLGSTQNVSLRLVDPNR